MQSSTKTTYVLTFDVDHYEDAWISDRFFPPSGAPRIGPHRLIFNRTVYYDRFHHFVGRGQDATTLHRRAIETAAGDYTIVAWRAASDGELQETHFGFTVAAGRPAFRLDALEAMRVSAAYTGASFAAELGGFLAAAKTGYDVAIRIAVVRVAPAWPRLAPAAKPRRLLTIVSTSAAQHAAMTALLPPMIPDAPRLGLDRTYAPGDQDPIDFPACWEAATAGPSLIEPSATMGGR